jgi:two-component system C4-dicarboxylate transport sensor histidine kinase DctB
VASDVAALVRAGTADGALTVAVHGERSGTAAIPPDALKQVVLNLVQNAREAVHEDGRIDLRIAKVPSGFVIDVEDNGQGIPEEVAPKLFDPFFTTKNSVQGVGLGLFVAEGVVRRYGGRLTAANREPGPGARFRIELAAATHLEEHT